MNLSLDNDLAVNYVSNSQSARVITEAWIADNMYCPVCGYLHINHFPANRPVADFFCPNCRAEYELKSKSGNISGKINDGAYGTMIERITSNNNPHLFVMSYSKEEMKVDHLMVVPKCFFVPAIIQKRKPLSDTARRAGWIGCNILLDNVPAMGKINIINSRHLRKQRDVMRDMKTATRLSFSTFSQSIA